MIDRGFEETKDWTCIITNKRGPQVVTGRDSRWSDVLPMELGDRAFYMLLTENGERP